MRQQPRIDLSQVSFCVVLMDVIRRSMLHGAEHHTVLDDLQFESASDGGGCLGRSRMLDTSWKAGSGNPCVRNPPTLMNPPPDPKVPSVSQGCRWTGHLMGQLVPPIWIYHLYRQFTMSANGDTEASS